LNVTTRNYFCSWKLKIILLTLLCCCLPEVPMFINRYGLRPRASSASGIERSPRPAAHSESTPTEQAGSASPHVCGSLPHIELGGRPEPPGWQQTGWGGWCWSKPGRASPASSIEVSQVLATVYTEDFSSSTPQDSSEDTSHPTDGDTTTPSTQPPILRRDLSSEPQGVKIWPFPLLWLVAF